MSKFFFLIILIFLSKTFNCSYSNCPCPTNTPDLPAKLPDKIDSFETKAVVIDNINYGIPIVLSNLVFLSMELTPQQSINQLEVKCPTGYRAPSSEEMQKVLTDTGSNNIFSVLTLSTGFAAKTNMKYVTSSKSYPTITEGNDNKAWMFKALSLDETKKTVTIVDVNTYFDKNLAVKCLMDSNGKNLPLSYYSKDLIVGGSYSFSVSADNIVSYLWVWGDGKNASTPSADVAFDSTGCYLIQLWVKNLANSILYSCIEKYVVSPFGSDGNSSLDDKTVSFRDLGYLAQPEIYIFFNAGRIPIAPKLTGGLYLVYTDSKTNILNIVEFDQNNKKINEKNLGIEAIAFDAVATDWGLVIYAKMASDNNNTFLLGYTAKTFEQKFKKTIMNNGTTPTSRKSDQIVFYDTDNSVLSGLEVMFAANNGKLAYGRGKIGLIFAHYNYFGNKNGKRDDHTGDSFFVFDDNGNNETYSWSWNTSHSLYQSHIYDGRYFVTASLGDVFPENIKVCFVDMTTIENLYDPVKKGKFKNPNKCKDIVPYNLPGDGAGKSCGRMGGLVNMGTNYAVIYSIRPCSINAYTGGKTSTNQNEIAIVTFNFENFDFKNVNKYTIINDASKVVNLRAGKYGDKILIAYAENASQTDNGAGYTLYTGKEEMSYTLVGFDGSVKTPPFKSTPTALSTSDDMKILSDGSLVWGYINYSNNTLLYRTVAPPLIQTIVTTPSEQVPFDSKPLDTTKKLGGNGSYIEISTLLYIILILSLLIF